MSVSRAQNTYLPGEGEGAQGGSRHQSKGSGGIQAEDRVKPRGTIRRRAAGSSRARLAGAGNRSRSGCWSPSLRVGARAALGCAGEPRGRGSPPARSRDRAWLTRNKGAAGPARARRRLFRGEALLLQRPSATAVIRAFQPQMWA